MTDNNEKFSNLKDIFLKNINQAYSVKYTKEIQESKILDNVALKLKQGFKIIHFYPDNNYSKDSLKIAQEIRQLCALFDSLFMVSLRLDIAKLSDSDGVILSNDDLSVDLAVKLLGSEKYYGKLLKSNENDFDINKFDYIVLKNQKIEINKKIIKEIGG